MSLIQPIILDEKEYVHGKTGKETTGYYKRVLHVVEYEAIRKAAKKFNNQLRLDLELLTAGRYNELRELQWNKQWFEWDNNALKIKEHKVFRVRRTPQRYVHLSNMGKTQVETFLNMKDAPRLPSYSAMRENLKRWVERANVDPRGLSVRCFRKTYESWLMFYYPEKSFAIFQSTGHTPDVAMEHYVNTPFNEEDKILMKKYVEGWE